MSYIFTPDERKRSQLGIKATSAATRRLRRAHSDEYASLLNEERAKLGLKPTQAKMTISEMKRLAEKAIAAGLDD